MAFFVGVDAGGTKTQCWVGDESRVLARGTAGTVKLMNVGAEVATERLRGLLLETLAEAGVRAEEVKRTAVGLAGISSEAVRGWAAEVLAATVGGRWCFVGMKRLRWMRRLGMGRGFW